MSEALGSPPSAPTPPPASDEASSEIPLWLVVGAVAVLVAALGLTAFVLLNQPDKKEAPVAAYPKTWDPRIVKYAHIAEKERGLTFVHPVAVRFLPKEEFQKDVRTDESELDKNDKQDLERSAGLLRAIGMLPAGVDLLGALNDAQGSDTLAYYSFDDQRVTVRGTEVTPAMRSTLVHELTHALQDQHFGIGKRMKELSKQGLDSPTTESSVLDAIVEGDAVRVEALYRDSLSAKQQAALDQGQKDDLTTAQAELKGVPKVIVTMMTAPYALGQAMMQAVADGGGNTAVDAMFREPPTHDAVLLDPFAVLSGDTSAKQVARPALAAGEKKIAAGEFGAVTWYFMLAERVPLVQALDAVSGWGGDNMVGFERDGRTCARVAYVGDTDRDTAAMLQALQTWVAGSGSNATVSPSGDGLVFESCDSASTTAAGKDTSENALQLAAVRSFLGINLMKAGAPQELAHCVADRLVHTYSAAQLSDPNFGANDPAVKARLQQVGLACRGAAQ